MKATTLIGLVQRGTPIAPAELLDLLPDSLFEAIGDVTTEERLSTRLLWAIREEFGHPPLNGSELGSVAIAVGQMAAAVVGSLSAAAPGDEAARAAGTLEAFTMLGAFLGGSESVARNCLPRVVAACLSARRDRGARVGGAAAGRGPDAPEGRPDAPEGRPDAPEGTA